MKRTLTALTVAASLIANVASAFDPADLQRLKDTKKCVGCDLTRADLVGAKLSGADLTGTNLSGAKLFEANLSRTIMTGVILCNTTMPDGSVIYSGC